LALNKIKFPAITICSQGLIQGVIDQALQKQFNDFITSLGKDPLTLTVEEAKAIEDNYTQTMYPGSVATPASMVNVLTSDNPSQSLKSKILTDPKSACIDVPASCTDPWMDPLASEAFFAFDFPYCMGNLGIGPANDDRCVKAGGSKVTFSTKDAWYSQLDHMISKGNFIRVFSDTQLLSLILY
jgi:hypothetical protein